jgi:hypothetical protein
MKHILATLESIPGGVNSPVRAFGAVGDKSAFYRIRQPLFLPLIVKRI